MNVVKYKPVVSVVGSGVGSVVDSGVVSGVDTRVGNSVVGGAQKAGSGLYVHEDATYRLKKLTRRNPCKLALPVSRPLIVERY